MKFSNEKYKESAKQVLNNTEITSNIKNEDAFLILIHNLDKENLDNLCKALAEKINITIEDAYLITQKYNNDYKELILETAEYLILNGKNLGNKIVDGHNASSFISHSIYEAILAKELAHFLKANETFAFNYGLLHDYGRKYTHKFDHVIVGFEKLHDMGLDDLAKSCLSHSFINGGRYCNNEKANDDFYVDANGFEHYSYEEEFDDLVEVLLTSSYSIYDQIINIADLMATSKGIVSPKERVDDIATRRGDVDNMPNRKYFLASFTNLLIDFLKKMGIELNIKKSDYINDSLEDIKTNFDSISNAFHYVYTNYKRNENLKKEKVM